MELLNKNDGLILGIGMALMVSKIRPSPYGRIKDLDRGFHKYNLQQPGYHISTMARVG